MSRVIKFRAWDLDNQEMYYTDRCHDIGDGPLVWELENDTVVFLENTCIDDNPGGRGHRQYMEYRKPNQVLMQFTGLIDPQGNEVYEGDILEECFGYGESALSVVSWCKDGYWIARELGSEGVPDYYDSLLSEHFETIVIGNIHQNADLIKND
jgi:uncharacterized phage protein (TIGR01671 family)